jgi:mono/diheme cytochrome c family protein
MRMTTVLRAVAALVGLWLLAGQWSMVSAQEGGGGTDGERLASQGAYTAEQAQRGQATYRQVCTSCHGQELTGGDDGPELVGGEFLANWTGWQLSELFYDVAANMPDDDPGSLSLQEYADVVAYILQVNGYGPGDRELRADSIDVVNIVIDAKPDGP